ncbi:right-handed parallel beta-helix repeat-containing protein [Flammeovirga sp. SubArs3]|uniref:right-handed parallel beta-helix repeat-containing protein n=1 Tax=Flammeovirga sp. SubArs3 TaxID=2995316 RepID=UPI00248B2E85|nr:right-handed parallel beta-helix repeat-containing protein [Flammeovirga sp. SubArs3]
MKLLLLGLTMLFFTQSAIATTYYVDAKNGKDKNEGTSAKHAFKTLKKINRLNLKAGDKVLLANGSVFYGNIELENIAGRKNKWIEISNYQSKDDKSDALPIIDAKGYFNGILIKNSSFIKVTNLEVTANAGGVDEAKVNKNTMRCGILVLSDQVGEYENITIDHVKVRDVFLMDEGFKRGKKETFTPNGTQGYGWGIRALNKVKDSGFKNLSITNCEISNVAHTGIKVNGKSLSIKNLVIANNKVIEVGGPGIQMSGINDGHIHHNIVNKSGSNNDTRKWGRGSGLWTWGCDGVLIERNEFRNANGPADSAGCHIDFNCSNVIVQYNISENNAGGFCEILGNNFNCAYRYNVSINDGYRVKKKGVASQEGKIFWLSGFNGKGRQRKGPYNSYFYNNTIYVKSDILVKIAVDRASKGVLIANNIFYFEGESKQVLGDQYKPEEEGEVLVENIVFKNNLYLKKENWPVESPITDSQPEFGNPQFKNKNGNLPTDFMPTNSALVKNKGIEIEKIPGDKKGLYIGEKVDKDILGNPIKDAPDLGAIEMK